MFKSSFPKLQIKDFFEIARNKVRPHLHQCVQFAQGDLREFANKPLQQPAIVFCRNTLYWLPPHDQLMFADQLSQNLPPRSRVVTGDMATDFDFATYLGQNGFTTRGLFSTKVLERRPASWGERLMGQIMKGLVRVAES